MEQEGAMHIYIVGPETINKTFIKTFLGEKSSSNKEETAESITEDVQIGNKEKKTYTLCIHQVPVNGGIGKDQIAKIKNPHAMIFLYNLSDLNYYKNLPYEMDFVRENIEDKYIQIVVGCKMDENEEMYDWEKYETDKIFSNSVEFFKIYKNWNYKVNRIISFIVKTALNLGNYKEDILMRGEDINHRDQFIEEDCGTMCDDFCNKLGSCLFCLFCPCFCCFK